MKRSSALFAQIGDGNQHPARPSFVVARTVKHPEAPSPVSNAAVTGEEAQGLTQTMALSLRERQILLLATRGLRRREISRALGLSENTVKWYIRALLERTECRSLHDVMRKMWFALR